MRWIQSYLAAQTERLSFNGELSNPISIQAGIPQRSLLSPILFILYITSLYNALTAHLTLYIIGFADDTNILAFGQTAEGTHRQLEGAWQTCEQWAYTRGMQFKPAKSELMHFTCMHAAPLQSVQLGDAIVQPVESA